MMMNALLATEIFCNFMSITEKMNIKTKSDRTVGKLRAKFWVFAFLVTCACNKS